MLKKSQIVIARNAFCDAAISKLLINDERKITEFILRV